MPKSEALDGAIISKRKDELIDKALPLWAIIELMGNNITAGYMEEADVCGQRFIRLEVPQVDGDGGFTHFLHPQAIYSFLPSDPETCKKTVKARQPKAHRLVLALVES